MNDAEEREQAPGSAEEAGAGKWPLPGDERFRMMVDGVKDYAIFTLDPEGYVTSWNSGAEDVKGYRADEVIGQHFSRFYPPEAVARRWPEFELQVAAREGRLEDEGWRVRRDGSLFWANVVITALRDDAGGLRGFLKITRDLTERRKYEESVRQSEERFRLMVEGVKDYAILMLDPAGHVVSWNSGAERIKLYRAEEIMGQHFSRFHPPEDIAQGKPDRELRNAMAQGRSEDEGWRVRKDGSRFWANVVITPLYDRGGLLRGFAQITRDMTERRRVEALEETGRRMQEFLAMLSHELRNPLAPIRNALTVMQTKDLRDPTLEWSRDVIDRQVTHLSRLVEDLLDVSRVTSGRITLRKELLDLSMLAERAVEAGCASIGARKQILDVRVAPEPLLLEGDSARLSQVVFNLLLNASKYTGEHGRIWLKTHEEDGAAILSVRDSGIGISSDLLERIFDLFAQGERSLDRSEGGLGIGLTLVRRIVELHGGTVEARSEGRGCGSEFIVRLPLRPRAKEKPTPRRNGGATAESGGPARRVLVVDDNPDSAESMAMLLRLWGHDALIARDGPAAIVLAESYRPELVLLDIGLPGMSGYDVAKRVRALPGSAGVIVVAVTGYGQDEDRTLSRQAGIEQHLVKPVDPSSLRKLVESLPAVPAEETPE